MEPRLAGGDDLLTELLYIRKDAGFTSDRIVNASILRGMLGGDCEPFEALRERFVSAINSLADPDVTLLLSAYALTPETTNTPTLRQRRQHYGQQIGRKIDTVATREDAAIQHLRAQLLTGWYPAAPLPGRVPELHNGIVLEAIDIVTVIADRHWQQTRECYRFLALFDEMDYVTISSSYPAKAIPEKGFRVTTKRTGESYSHQFWHHTPMRRGHFYDLSFTLIPDPKQAVERSNLLLTEDSRAFHERTLTASFEAVFIGGKPARIWQFERLSFFERPGNPSPRQLLDFKETSSVKAHYRDLYGGLFNGVAWEW
ncbi:hypothetical protein BKG68_04180 [Mycobacteroides saopaulense]|uniref:WYL domain-containing protein n=1 Tax=Mycobacteroides saopaulense TaxID=1578165 RepID=A0ABX3C5W3_9MYCO|nr:hypothetical protein BKG68_04180 [Mycobacteroides saopaulense]OHU13877.1 hypothetical protein BKG73_04190 [Mycobacteroides saopaulense]